MCDEVMVTAAGRPGRVDVRWGSSAVLAAVPTLPEMPSDDAPGPHSRHVPALDGLRGLAVLGVMGFHLFPGNFHGRTLQVLASARSAGAVGVDLFFALSGFLITGILYDSTADTGYFRKFYIRRALRIFPLYYGVLAVLLVVTPWVGIAWRGMDWVLLGYLQNTDVNGPFYEFQMGPGLSLDHFWSLAVEEQFYLVWPLVVFVVRNRRQLLWICAGLSMAAPLLRFALALHGTDPDYINRSTFCRMDTLLLGAMLALAVRGREGVLRASRGVFWSAAGVLGVVSLGWMLVGGGGQARFADAAFLAVRYSLGAVAAAALIGWSLETGTTVRRVFEGRTLRFFGRYSYGLYVFHFLALAYLIRTFKVWVAVLTPNKVTARRARSRSFAALRNDNKRGLSSTETAIPHQATCF
jgi:peptidoglycan/LPS O-acetylase OafA/YrhL